VHPGRRAAPEQHVTRDADRRLSDERELHAFVLELGRAPSLAGTAVSETQERLQRIAAANDAGDARVVVLPTALILAFGRARSATIESIPQLAGTLRLDQISALYDVVDEAERGAVDPVEGLRRLKRIRTMPPRQGAAVTVVAYAGNDGCALPHPPPAERRRDRVRSRRIVGALIHVARGQQTLTVLVPVVSATIVAAISFEAVQPGVADPGLRTSSRRSSRCFPVGC
jgi:hypothetical protein